MVVMIGTASLQGLLVEITAIFTSALLYAQG